LARVARSGSCLSLRDFLFPIPFQP